MLETFIQLWIWGISASAIIKTPMALLVANNIRKKNPEFYNELKNLSAADKTWLVIKELAKMCIPLVNIVAPFKTLFKGIRLNAIEYEENYYTKKSKRENGLYNKFKKWFNKGSEKVEEIKKEKEEKIKKEETKTKELRKARTEESKTMVEQPKVITKPNTTESTRNASYDTKQVATYKKLSLEEIKKYNELYAKRKQENAPTTELNQIAYKAHSAKALYDYCISLEKGVSPEYITPERIEMYKKMSLQDVKDLTKLYKIKQQEKASVAELNAIAYKAQTANALYEYCVSLEKGENVTQEQGMPLSFRRK